MMGWVLSDLRVVVGRFLSHDGFLLAAGLSYSFLLCLAPLALLFFSGAGYLLQSDEIAGYVLETVRSLFPGYGSEMLQALVTLARERRVTGVVGGVGLAIFATQFFSMTRTVVNVAFRVEKRRGMFHGFLFDGFALAVAGLLAAAVSAGILALVTLGSPVLRSAVPPPLVGMRWARAVALPLMYAAMFGLLFFVYRTFPKTGVATRAAAVGALTVAVLWETARWVFSAYVGGFGVYGTLYGSFGVIVASLVWIYFSAAIFVLGAELTALLTEREQGAAAESIAEPAAAEGPPPSPPPRTLPIAAAAILGAAAALFALQNGSPITLRFLVWAAHDVPLAGVVLLALAVGALIVGLPLSISRWRLRARLRRLEAIRRTAGPGSNP